jgi:hypothetical protein
MPKPWYKRDDRGVRKCAKTGMIKPISIVVLADPLDITIEYDRLEYEDFVQEKSRKVARALARERDLAYEKGVINK